MDVVPKNIKSPKKSMEDLPDSLLVEGIFSYFDMQTLLSLGRVNRRFYRLSQDKRFWKRIDCAEMRFITLIGLRKLIMRPSAVHLISLRWEGYIRRSPGCRRVASSRPCVRKAATPSSLELLAQRCPNLRELHIVYANLEQVTLRHFPPTLEFLGFEGSVVSFDFFGPLQDPSVLPNLRGLDLNFCHNLSSHSSVSFAGILSRRELTTLQLKHCFKLSFDDMAQIPERLPNLQTLNVSELSTVDAAFIEILATHARSLKRLDISFCKIDTDGIERLATSTVCRLEKLYAIETQLDDKALILLARHQPQLKYVNVVKTHCTAEGVAAFSVSMVGVCRVEHKSTEGAGGEKFGGSIWWVDGRLNVNVSEDEMGDNNAAAAADRQTPMEH